jgi:hypothetical protein
MEHRVGVKFNGRRERMGSSLSDGRLVRDDAEYRWAIRGYRFARGLALSSAFSDF